MKKIICTIVVFLISFFSFSMPNQELPSPRIKKASYFTSSQYQNDIYDISFEDEKTPLQVLNSSYEFQMQFPEVESYQQKSSGSFDLNLMYTITNPTSEDITTNIDLPFVCYPNSSTAYDADILTRYSAYLNDEKLDSACHYFYHTYSEKSFTVPSFDEESWDESYPKDMKFFYREFDYIQPKEDPTYCMYFTLPEGMKINEYMFGNMAKTSVPGEYRLYYDPVILFVSEDRTEDFLSRVKFYTDEDKTEETTASLELKAEASREFTLEAIIQQVNGESSEIPFHDYYQALVTKLKQSEKLHSISYRSDFDFFDIEGDLLGVFIYPLTVKAKATVNLKIEAPLYPANYEISYSHFSFGDNYINSDIYFHSVKQAPFDAVTCYSLSFDTNAELSQGVNFYCGDLKTENGKKSLELAYRLDDGFSFHTLFKHTPSSAVTVNIRLILLDVLICGIPVLLLVLGFVLFIVLVIRGAVRKSKKAK